MKPRWSAPANSPDSCDHAAHARAKVVLVGDHHQLPAIEAGGAFAALAERLGAIHLTNNQRQGDPIERAALSELRAGDPARAIDLLDYGNRISRHRDRDGAYADNGQATGSPAPSTAKT